MNLLPVLARLRDELPHLMLEMPSQITSLDRETYPVVQVLPADEAVAETEAFSSVVQVVQPEVAVVVIAEAARRELDHDPLAAALSDVRAALIGYQDATWSHPLTLVKGEILAIDAGRVAWRDTYTTRFPLTALISQGDSIADLLVEAASLLDDYAKVYGYAAELRGAGTPTAAYTVRTLGALDAGDGGGGLWRWDATSTATDNLGTVLLPSGHSGAGRWVRVIDHGRVTAQAFGAAGDGATDDEAAINAALAANSGAGWTLVFPAQVYRVDSNLLLYSNSRIHCEPGMVIERNFGGGGGADNATLHNEDTTNGNSAIKITGVLRLRDPAYVATPTDTYKGKQFGLKGACEAVAIERMEIGDNRGWATSIQCSTFHLGSFHIDNPSSLITDDGLHFRGGTDITVGAITGVTGDDLFALTDEGDGLSSDIARVSVGAINGRVVGAGALFKIAAVAGSTHSISDVTIGAINGDGGPASSYCITLRDLTGTGLVHDISVGAGVVHKRSGTGGGLLLLDQVTATRLNGITFVDDTAGDSPTGWNILGCSRVTLRDCQLIGYDDAATGAIRLAATGFPACAEITIAGGRVENNNAAGSGIVTGTAVSVTTGLTLEGVTFACGGVCIPLVYVTDSVIKHCTLSSGSTYGLSVGGAASVADVMIAGNYAAQWTTAPYAMSNTGYVSSGNRAKGAAYTGIATIDDGAGFVDVTHNLGVNDYVVVLTGNTADQLRYNNLVAGSFRISRSGTSGACTVGWQLEHTYRA